MCDLVSDRLRPRAPSSRVPESDAGVRVGDCLHDFVPDRVEGKAVLVRHAHAQFGVVDAEDFCRVQEAFLGRPQQEADLADSSDSHADRLGGVLRLFLDADRGNDRLGPTNTGVVPRTVMPPDAHPERVDRDALSAVHIVPFGGDDAHGADGATTQVAVLGLYHEITKVSLLTETDDFLPRDHDYYLPSEISAERFIS